MAAFGTLILFLALGVSAFSVIASVAHFTSGQKTRPTVPVAAVLITAGLLTLAELVLAIALVTHNFRLEYVASYSSTGMSFPYLISALWAGNSGSLMFWAWILSIFSVVLVLQKKNRQNPQVAYAAPVLMFTVLFFCILLLATARPFLTLATPPANGQGLNPQLQNPGMIFHPPFLLAGYAGLAIPFALAMGALFSGHPNDSWLASARRWALFAWLLLGIGNLIGMWWAYVELGWGGYWAWDPVENAGLMPWLVATAFIHSLMMQKRRGTFKVWNMALIIATFNLTIFGTFMTRGGFSPMHSWQGTGMAPYFLTFIAITLVVPIWMLVSHRKDLKGSGEIESVVSREGTFFLSNLLLVVITAVTLVGSVVPAVLKLMRGGDISVNQTFFNMVNSPLLLGVVLLAGLCTVIGWRKMTGKELLRRYLWPAVLSIVLGIVLAVLKVNNAAAIAGYMLSAFALLAVASQWLFEIRAGGKSPATYPSRFWNLLRANQTRYGAYIVHIAIAVIAIGIIGSSLFDVSKEATLAKGNTLSIKDYTVKYDTVVYAQQGDNDVVRATINVSKGGKSLGTMYPKKLYSASYDQWVSEVAIRSTPAEDLYIILGDWQHDATGASIVTIKVLVNPLVDWVWIGGGLFMVGGLIAFWPGRQPAPTESEAEAQAVPAGQPAKPPASAPSKPAPGARPQTNPPPRPVNARKKARNGRKH